MEAPRSILITGASSGIGRALSLAYAGGGVLHLGGRDMARLEETARTVRARGGTATVRAVDITDRQAVAGWIEEADDESPLDLVIANAGISAGTGKGGESVEQVRRIFATNVDGVLNTLEPAISRMRDRRRGQLAIMSSLAAFRGFPGAPAYCASKAAVRIYGEALRGELREHGIVVSVICPGFVESPMTAVNRFPMPMLMPAEKAARIIVRGLRRDLARIAFPLPLYFAVLAISALSPRATDPLLRRLPKKG